MRRKYTENARTPGVGYLPAHNPLYRRSDRIQARVKSIAITLAIVMVPIAAWLGMSTLTTQQARVAVQQTSVHEATATTTVDAAEVPITTSEMGAMTTSSVDARWTHAGVEHTGPVSVASGAAAGTQIQIYVDDNGAHTARPTSDADAVTAALFSGFGSYFVLTMMLVGMYSAVRHRLDSQRDAEWDLAIKNLLDA